MSKRQHKRYTKRLETEFSTGGMTCRGISSDLSVLGLFIRTQHGFVPDSEISIRLYLPDGRVSNLKGIVRRTVKTHISFIKNGMGVAIISSDSSYRDFIHTELIGDEQVRERQDRSPNAKPLNTAASPENHEDRIIRCPACHVKNKVKASKLSLNPKCGKCGDSLT